MVFMFIALVFRVLSYYVSLCFEFHVEMSVTSSTLSRRLVRIHLQLFCRRGSCFIYVMCVCLHRVVSSSYIVLCICFPCLRLVYPMLPVSLECPFLVAPSVFSNVYLFCFSSSCVSYVTSFSGLSIFDCPFGIL